MNKNKEQEIKSLIKNFKLPKFNELPNFGLFLEQTVNYINTCLKPLEEFKITSSMISNYVKHNVISSPVSKLYSKEQIAYLIYITICKNVMSLKDILALFKKRKNHYTIETAYNYFCDEFDNILQYVFENKKTIDFIGGKLTKLKKILQSAITAIANKIYINKILKII